MNFSGLIDSEIKFSVKSESIVVLQNYYYIFNEREQARAFNRASPVLVGHGSD